MIACSTHASKVAGWRCGLCANALCVDCASWRKAGSGHIEVCNLCGGHAAPILERRAVLKPFGAGAIQEAIRWPFHKEGLATAAACAAVLWLISKAGALAGLFACGIVLAICFHVTTTTARGEDELTSGGDFRGFFEDVAGPLVRALVASVWAYAPIVWYILWRRGGMFENGDLSKPHGVDAAIAVALLLLGTFLFPMALLAGALGTPVRQLLNPMVVVGYAVRLGRDYALMSGFACAISVTLSLLLNLLDGIDKHVTRLPGLVEYFVLLLPALMLFRAMGLLVRARGDELGYGGEKEYLEPVLGGLMPATELTDAPPLEEPPPPPQLSDEEQQTRAYAASAAYSGQGAEIELPPEVTDLPPALLLAQRVTAKDTEGAIEVVERIGKGVPANALSAQAWVELGKACAARDKAQAAMVALRKAVDIAPEGPLAPQAWLQAARICDEKLQNRAQSDQLLGELLKRHPGTAEAAFAAKRLGKP